MKNTALLWLCGFACVPGAVSQQQEFPVIHGYVTRVASNSDFDVNGVHVICNGVEYLQPGSVRSATGPVDVCPAETPFLGEGIAVYGTEGIPANSVYATRIETHPPHRGAISGSAVIDAMPAQGPSGAQAPELLIRADGYRIRITGTTKIEWGPPLQSLADVKAGNWIRYHGKQDAAGVVTAASVRIGPNSIGSGEVKLRTENEYDPSAAPPNAIHNYLKDALAGGCDPKKPQPFKDAEMQARIEKIGKSLIPAYQRALPDSDPAKINFRFQLVDAKHSRDACMLPSGIILVPHQAVERMQNDFQLAAVLADAIARALERQQYRSEGKQKAAIAATFASAALAGYGGGSIAAEGMAAYGEILTKEMEQSGRVSLDLLHDAGYDIDQAPLAWWLLDPEKPQPVAAIEIPARAVYLYRVLGETWHNPAASAPEQH